jgi:hypothetical protein
MDGFFRWGGWRFLIWAVCALCISGGGTVHADEGPEGPFLRIEAGKHVGPIFGAATDAAGSLAVTGSWDKTVRVWSLPDGQLLQILRPPIGPGQQGQVHAVAMTPDGSTIAAGGAFRGPGRPDAIYVFDRVSGRIMRNLPQIPATVQALVYSKDGRRLVAGLHASGIRAFDTADYTPLPSDSGYKGPVFALDFDAAGRLATGSYDGRVRLYDAGGFAAPASTSQDLAGEVLSVAFSPDGKRIAVGFHGARVELLSSQGLNPLRPAPSLGGVVWAGGDLGEVAWSARASRLFAAGDQVFAGARNMRGWEAGGRGAHVDILAGGDTVERLRPLPDGSILAVTADPWLGVISPTGDSRVLQGRGQLDFRGRAPMTLRASDDAKVVDVVPWHSDSHISFSLSRRTVESGSADMPGLSLPVIETAELQTTDWWSNPSPKLNHQQLKLLDFERSQSVAIARDGSGLVLGTSWGLYRFAKDGRQVWRKTTESPAWQVNVPGSGGVAVSAESDGTIRWYRLRDGEPLLALFIASDRRRWIVFTPQGYFDASPGGEELIGWQVNNAGEQPPDFYPVGQFRDRYYRPDVIQRVLDTLDVDEALAQADVARNQRTEKVPIAEIRPPVIEVLDPRGTVRTSQPRLALTYRIRSPAAPVTGLKVLVNDKAIALDKSQEPDPKAGLDYTGSVAIELPRSNATVSLVAVNQYATSQPAKVVVEWSGKVQEPLPDLYVLAVGVRNYLHPVDPSNPLKYPDRDATEFVAAMRRQEEHFYAHVIPHPILINEQATIDAIKKGFVWLRRNMGSRDVAMIYLSGHGLRDSASSYDFLPYDADPDNPELTDLHGHDIKYMLGDMPGLKVLFVDSCHSGNVWNEPGQKGDDSLPDMNDLANQLTTAGSGTIVFTSSQGKELSREDDKWGHGAFTKLLLEGLNGAADNPLVHISELDVYIEKMMKQLNPRQHPTMVRPPGMSNIAIARVQ